MRTTLNLDDDVLATAKVLAVRQRRPLGAVVSGLIRRAVEPLPAPPSERNGIPLFPVSQGARPVTPEIVSELLDQTP
ncbi:MAG: CopG family transcriptional regulator [Verrucomicrobiota bacterium]